MSLNIVNKQQSASREIKGLSFAERKYEKRTYQKFVAQNSREWVDRFLSDKNANQRCSSAFGASAGG
jgi:hypothetical protein